MLLSDLLKVIEDLDYTLQHQIQFNEDLPNPVFGTNCALYTIDSDDIHDVRAIELVVEVGTGRVLGLTAMYEDARVCYADIEYLDALRERVKVAQSVSDIPMHVWTGADSFYEVCEAVESLLEGATHRYGDDEQAVEPPAECPEDTSCNQCYEEEIVDPVEYKVTLTVNIDYYVEATNMEDALFDATGEMIDDLGHKLVGGNLLVVKQTVSRETNGGV